MQNIELNDGKLVTIGSFDDALSIVSEHLSHDLKDCIKDYFNEIDFDYSDVKDGLEILQNDFEELEKENNRLENENWKQRNEIMDLKHEIERLKDKNDNDDNILPFS